ASSSCRCRWPGCISARTPTTAASELSGDEHREPGTELELELGCRSEHLVRVVDRDEVAELLVTGWAWGARVLPIPMTGGRVTGRPVQATAIVMVEMPESYPIWWQDIDSPPPAEWVFMFEDLTGDDTAEQWALAAAIFIAQTRRRTAAGPTFAELFTHLLPDTDGLPGLLPRNLDFAQRRRAVAGFRGHAAIEWRRREMISFDKGVMRSLRVGREFRERSRRRQQAREAARRPRGPESGTMVRLANTDSTAGTVEMP
ncbi:hypothetical protein, partial [Microbacterium sp. K24]|uniref:hypothetical protein n=1 Tax=Microbacterium sp. K24 TaxID=2305446 RepID=UPI001443B1D5